MNYRTRLALSLAATTLALAGFVACGGDNGGGGTASDAGADATTDTGTGNVDTGAPDTSTGGNDTGSPDTGAPTEAGGSDTGAGDDGGPGDGGATDGATDSGLAWDGSTALNCTDYCGLVMSTCTGQYAQYQSVGECMNACALLPMGAAGDMAGDTIGCRIYHAELAADAGVNPHCWHAGPYGFGACGTNCDSFCTMATAWCSPMGGFDGGAAPYNSKGMCSAACMMYTVADGGADPGAYNAAGPQTGNTLDCREWHLGAALADHAAQQVHCNHVGQMSPTCM